MRPGTARFPGTIANASGLLPAALADGSGTRRSQGPTMKIKHGLISADSHAVIDRNAFIERMPKRKFGERIPHVGEIEANGAKVERWIVNGRALKTRGVCNCPAAMDHPARNV